MYKNQTKAISSYEKLYGMKRPPYVTQSTTKFPLRSSDQINRRLFQFVVSVLFVAERPGDLTTLVKFSTRLR